MANSDNKVFDMMTAAADKTAVDLFPVEFEKSTDSIHNALMAAGMTPAYGNVADLADAALYALEGEFGDAAWSSAAALPVIGQMVSAKKALKVAKEAGEEMVTLYRGVPEWLKGKMVKKGKFIGGGEYVRGMKGATSKITGKSWTKESFKNTLWTTTDLERALGYGGRGKKAGKQYMVSTKPIALEFEVPRSYIKKYGHFGPEHYDDIQLMFEEGLPKEFLKKVHK